MNISLNINAETANELVTAVKSLAGVFGNPEQPAPANEPKKAGKKPATETAPDVAQEETRITIEPIRELAMKKRDSGKREELKGLLEEFNVTRVTDLKQEQYTDFLAKLEAL